MRYKQNQISSISIEMKLQIRDELITYNISGNDFSKMISQLTDVYFKNTDDPVAKSLNRKLQRYSSSTYSYNDSASYGKIKNNMAGFDGNEDKKAWSLRNGEYDGDELKRPENQSKSFDGKKNNSLKNECDFAIFCPKATECKETIRYKTENEIMKCILSSKFLSGK